MNRLFLRKLQEPAILVDKTPPASPQEETPFRALPLLNNELMSLPTIAQLLISEQVHFVPNGTNQSAQILWRTSVPNDPIGAFNFALDRHLGRDSLQRFFRR